MNRKEFPNVQRNNSTGNVCYRCNDPGHMANRCPIRNNPQGRIDRNVDRKPMYECRLCPGMRHRVEHCPVTMELREKELVRRTNNKKGFQKPSGN